LQNLQERQIELPKVLKTKILAKLLFDYFDVDEGENIEIYFMMVKIDFLDKK